MALVWLLLFPTVAWGLPGWLATRWLFPTLPGEEREPRSALETVALSVVLGLVLVVPAAFAWSFFGRIVMTPVMILTVSAVWTVVFTALLRLRPPPAPAAPPRTSWPLAAAVIAIAVTATLIEAPRAVEATEIWAPCPHQSTLYLLEDGSGPGLEAYDPNWQETVRHVTEHKLEPGFGMKKVLTYQRVGSTATLVQPVAFFGSGGFVVATFLYYFLIAAFGTLLALDGLAAHGLTPRTGAWVSAVAAAIGTVFVIGVRVIAVYTVNENVLALGLSMPVLWLLRRRLTLPMAAAAGAVFALCLATRPMAVGMVPAIAMLLVAGAPNARQRLAVAACFAVGVVLFVLPFVMAQHQLFGVGVTDPSLFQVRTEHELFGYRFLFHPLNWPFVPDFVRGSNEPLPLLLQIPLEHLRAFGLVFGVLGVLGLAVSGWRTSGPALLWGLPGYTILMALVSLDHHKLSYALTVMGSIPLLVGAGAGALGDGRWTRRRRAMMAALASIALVGAQAGLGRLEFPPDARPQYNDEVGRFDDPPLDDKRAYLTLPSPFPHLTFDVSTAGLAVDLLLQGHPPQRHRREPGAPVFVWKQLPEITHELTLTPGPEPRFPPYFGDLEGGLELTDSAVVMSIAVATSEPIALTVRSDGHRIEVDLGDAPEATPSGARYFLSLAIIDDGVENLGEVEVRFAGRPVPVRYHSMQRHGERPRIRMVMNHPAVLTPVDSGGTVGLALGIGGASDTPSPCERRELAGQTVGLGPEGVLVTAGPDLLRFLEDGQFPPREPTCDALQFPEGPREKGPIRSLRGRVPREATP